MHIFESYGLDFFYPYQNCPIPPYRDDDMVVIGLDKDEELEKFGYTASAAEAMYVPLPEAPEHSQTEASAIGLPSLKKKEQEMTTIKTYGSEPVRDFSERVYIREVQGAERQILKTTSEEQIKRNIGTLIKKLESKELEHEFDEL